MKGKIFLVEGTDCSGKETQTRMLLDRLKDDEIPVATMGFPRYDTPTGRIVGQCYLGKEGLGEGDTNWFMDANAVNPAIASLYYAADRLAAVPEIEEITNSGTNLILDRYVESNMAHQGGKVNNDKKREKIIDYISALEYGLLNLPKPDETIFLFMPYQIGIELRKGRSEKADGHDEETKEKMKAERDLGPIYGFQWRHFDAEYNGFEHDYSGEGVDQLKNVVDTIKKNPNDRRMIVNAWNPKQLNQMALPPCHYGFQVLIGGDNKLHLSWNQRSVDTPLGLPFNIASYGMLQHLLAEETGYKSGILTGNLGDTHIYVNQLEGVKEQLSRTPRKLPTIETKIPKGIFGWEHNQTKIKGYNPHDKISFPIAV